MAIGKLRTALCLGSCLAMAGQTHGIVTESKQTRSSLSVVKPQMSCEALAGARLGDIASAHTAVGSAKIVETPKGAFCRVVSDVDPAIVVTTYLPAEHWTQRYYQAAGLMAGPEGYPTAGTCQPALDGEFVYASSNQRFTMVVGDHDKAGWKPDPQRRIDYAYRANHITALVSKALIRAYYGQGPRYSYFMGCSEGGREALEEAQRFPTDFDGISAGAPGLLDTAQESMFHPWKMRANLRADGTNILLPDKLKLLHAAVVARCDTLSGVHDDILEDPSACHFQPSTMQCAGGRADSSDCFTAEEVAAINRLYDGAHDANGHYFYWGQQRGSEAFWSYPASPTARNTNADVHTLQLAYILLPAASPELVDPEHVAFRQSDFDRAASLSPLFDAGDADLKAFAASGGKLILWHGISDNMIPVEATIAYYRAAVKTLGPSKAKAMLRAFFLPGVGHCGGGDGYDQIDALSALMSWVELRKAPTQIISGKASVTPHASASTAPSDAAFIKPYAKPTPPLSATRPVFPFPAIARYSGTGDPNDAANYVAVERPGSFAPVRSYAAVRLIGSNVLRDYEVRDSHITEVAR